MESLDSTPIPGLEVIVKRLLFSLLLSIALIIGFSLPVLSVGLGISPTSIDISLGEEESITKDFYIYYFEGAVDVEVVDVPVLINPSSFEIQESPTMVSVTLTNSASSSGDYSGYLRFTGVGADNTSLAVQVSVNAAIDANLEEESGGGGGGGGGRDRMAPIISDIGLCLEGITETTADICWKTHEKSDSQVEYWASLSMFSELDEEMVINHHVRLTGLIPGTTYYYKTMSRDAADNLRVSGECTFTTETGVLPEVLPEPTPSPVPTPKPTPSPEPTTTPTPLLPVEIVGGGPNWLIVLGVLIVVLGGVWFGVRWYKRRQLNW